MEVQKIVIKSSFAVIFCRLWCPFGTNYRGVFPPCHRHSADDVHRNVGGGL